MIKINYVKDPTEPIGNLTQVFRYTFVKDGYTYMTGHYDVNPSNIRSELHRRRIGSLIPDKDFWHNNPGGTNVTGFRAIKRPDADSLYRDVLHWTLTGFVDGYIPRETTIRESFDGHVFTFYEVGPYRISTDVTFAGICQKRLNSSFVATGDTAYYADDTTRGMSLIYVAQEGAHSFAVYQANHISYNYWGNRWVTEAYHLGTYPDIPSELPQVNHLLYQQSRSSINRGSAPDPVALIHADPRSDMHKLDTYLDWICDSSLHIATQVFKQDIISENLGRLCVRAVDTSTYVRVNMIEFMKDIGMTFAEFPAWMSLVDKTVDNVVKSRHTRKWARSIVNELKEFRIGSNFVPFWVETKHDRLANKEFYKALLKAQRRERLKTEAKEASSVYLAHHYGTKLTMNDLEKISTGISSFIWNYYSAYRHKTRQLHSHDSFNTSYLGLNWDVEMNYNLCYNPYQGISEINEFITNLGWGLNYHQVWEAIPFSFVVDWFKDITTVLKAFDTEAYYRSLAICYEAYSVKLKQDVTSLLPYEGAVEFSYYLRRVSPTPTIHPCAGDISGTPQKHFLQGAALIVQAM